MSIGSAQLRVTAGLAALLMAYPLMPRGSTRDIAYSGFSAICIAVAFWGLHRRRPARRSGWTLLLIGFLGWVVGDGVYALEQGPWHLAVYPAPSDAVYIASYGLMAAGLATMVRRRGSRGNISPLLDAAIVATGTAVLTGVFVIAPIANDSSLTVWGKLVSSLYPMADVLLLGILVRLWTAPGARSAAFRLLVAALGTTLLADALYNVSVLATGEFDTSAWNDLLWLSSYLLVASAVWSKSMTELSELSPGRAMVIDPRKRVMLMTGGLVLPAVTLLVAGLTTGPVGWPIVAAGSIVLSGLVVARMVGLLKVVQTQAVQLAALARSDSLTGAPNRRTWDYELSRACQTARTTGTPLTVALLDLDNFKRYNDTYGHPAGDLVLREATAAWVELLEDGEMLARYGGEEFAVLLPGRTVAQARDRLESLLLSTPHDQTFSAGIALWDPSTEPSKVVSDADNALYNAKRAGRNRISVATSHGTVALLPELSIVLQPIVNLDTTVPVAVEALSRFVGQEPMAVFEEAHRTGTGPHLEAAAIRAALAQRPATGVLSMNVSLDALTSPQVQEALAGDLTGVMLEITEHTDPDSFTDLAKTLKALRKRGAVIAIDDWGQGFSNLDRLLRLRPDVVKLDISLIQSLDSDYHREVVRSVTSWANAVGVRVCAEGIETEQQWRILQDLGVHMGQGYFFGRPAAPEASAKAETIEELAIDVEL